MDYQAQFHSSDKRFRVIAGGRRAGKSQSAFHELLSHCLSTPNALAWWLAPTYRDAKEVGWEMFEQHIELLSPAIRRINKTNLSIEFINNSKLLFKGSDNENSLRGRGLTAVVLDEAAFMKEDVWTKAVRPALSDRRGWAVFTSTPNGRNWYYYIHQKASFPSNGTLENGLANWKGYHWPTVMNPIIGEAEVNEAKSNLSDIDFRQEYGAEFVTKAGMVYDDFDEDFNVFTNEADLSFSRLTHEFFLGVDFGFVNPTAICLMAICNNTQNIYQLDELYVTRTPIKKIHDLITGMLAKHKINQSDIKYVFTDPAGNADELSSGISPVDSLRSDGWNVLNKGSEVAPGLALVRSYICNAHGHRRYFIHERCKETIRSIQGYCYKLGIFKRPTEEPDKDNLHDHMCDAVRYFFVNRFDNAKYIFSSIKQEPYGRTKVDTAKGRRIMKRCGECRKKFISFTPINRPPFMCNDCQEQLHGVTQHAN